MKRLLLFAVLCSSLALGQATKLGPISATTIEVGVGGITSVPGDSNEWGPVPLGPDIAILVRGTADDALWSFPYSQLSSTTVSTGVHDITVPTTAYYYTNFPDLSGVGTALFIESEDDANFEALTAGTNANCSGFTPPSGIWCIKNATKITANFTKTHAASYAVWQAGAVFARAHVFGQTAQDGNFMWFCQQDSESLPYRYSCWNGDGAFAWLSYDGTNTLFKATDYLDTTGTFGLFFTATQSVLKTGANAASFIKDANDVQQARFTNTETDIPSLNVNSSAAVITSAGKGTFNAGLDANSIGITHAGPIAGATTVNASGLATVGGISAGATPTANHAVCWKTSTTLSYCTTVVAADGTCTCN